MDVCNQIRESSEGFQMALILIKSQRSQNTKYFALQVLEYQLPKINEQQLLYVRDELVPYIFSRFDSNSGDIDASFMRNKFAEILSFLFSITYIKTWPSFFTDLLQTVENNSRAVDFYLRVLQIIHSEIGDNLIIRDQATTKNNNLLKDAIRERDMVNLAASWKEILSIYISKDTTNNNEEDGLRNVILENCLNVIGGWISWIEASLIVDNEYLSLIFQLLGDENQRLNACDTICEIVSKKMKPINKLNLIQILNLTNIINQIPGDLTDLDFIEKIARLFNIVGVELIYILDSTNNLNEKIEESELIKAEEELNNLFPFILQFFENEYDDITIQVLPVITDYLTFVRKVSKDLKTNYINNNLNNTNSNLIKNPRGGYLNFPNDSNFINQTRREIIIEILNKIIIKMKYDNDSNGNSNNEEDSEFLEFRMKLRVLQDMIANIDSDLFIDKISIIISDSLDNINNNDWREIELGLYELSLFGESVKNGSINSIKGIENKGLKVNEQLFIKMINSNILNFNNHPIIQLLFMELVVKHHNFFISSSQASSTTSNSKWLTINEKQELILKVLQLFVSEFGLNNNNEKVKLRSWYLFYRFIKLTKPTFNDNNIIRNLIISISESLLIIKAEFANNLDSNSTTSDSSIEFINNADQDTKFTSQLYLFESVGLLIANDNCEIDEKVKLIETILNPIYLDLENNLKNVTTNNDQQQLLIFQIHHHLMAIGTFSKGFDTDGSSLKIPTSSSTMNENDNSKIEKVYDPRILQEFLNASHVVLVALETLSNFQIIRDSARFSFSRFIPILNFKILENIKRLILLLLNPNCLRIELIDFLGFFGQLIHKFKNHFEIFDILNSLIIPIFEQISFQLNNNDVNSDELINSTDITVEKSQLRRSYFTFLFNILNNGNMGNCLVSESNKSILENIIDMTLISAFTINDSTTAKSAFAVLSKMTSLWGSSSSRYTPITSDDNSNNQELVGIDQFLMENFTRLCWETPFKPDFDIKDAQCRVISVEIAGLMKTMFEVKQQELIVYLKNIYFPSVPIPEDVGDEYLNALTQSQPKQFKKFFVDFVIRLTGK